MSSNVKVDAPCGPLTGRRQGGITAFLGIPYAEAPTGSRRFAAPVSRARFEKPFEAFRYGPSAPQKRTLPGPLAKALGAMEDFDEDCLSLNVWTPDVSGKRPVLVFIHGGGFIIGAGSQYPGDDLARRGDVVVVTMNYRLGLFGFNAFAEIYDEDDRFVPNAGLLDQRLALQWVRDNIAAFGGDPDQVTIGGESAGAASVGFHLVAQRSHPLFDKAIMQSGGLNMFYGKARAAEVGEELLRMLGARASPEGLFRLPTEAFGRLVRNAASRFPGIVSRPYVDGMEIAGDTPLDLARDAKPVPLLIGTNRDEFTFFMDLPILPTATSMAALTDQVARFAGQEAAKRVTSLYHDDRQGRVEAGTDLLFRMPAIQFADRHAEFGQGVYFYRLDWEAKGMLRGQGATHSVDLPLLFEGFVKPFRSIYLGIFPDPLRHNLEKRMRRHWLEFVRKGRPGISWPAYEGDDRQTMIFDERDRILDDPEAEHRRAWQGVDGFLW